MAPFNLIYHQFLLAQWIGGLVVNIDFGEKINFHFFLRWGCLGIGLIGRIGVRRKVAREAATPKRGPTR
jgi:hypothetical protein